MLGKEDNKDIFYVYLHRKKVTIKYSTLVRVRAIDIYLSREGIYIGKIQ